MAKAGTILLLWLLLQSVAHAQATLEEIKQLSEKGAVSLAIKLLEQSQPQNENVDSTWFEWEQLRISLYQKRQDWQKISQRLNNIPKAADVSYIQWAKTERAQALLELRQSVAAREELRYLIWKTQVAETNLQRLNQWRKLIIRSYLIDGFATDAELASFRLQQAQPKVGLDDLMLRARIAIQNKRADEASRLLKPYAEQPEVAALILLAQLRSQSRSPKHILQAAYRYIRNEKTPEQLKVDLWAVAAEASRQNGSRAAAADALEHVLASNQQLHLSESIYQLDSNLLWNAYIDYALLISNQEHLLIGQDKAWLDVASELAHKQPVGARAMNVFVMLRGRDPARKDQAARSFVSSILGRNNGRTLLLNLFKDTKYFKTLAAIPEPVRHALVDIALAQSNIDRASEIMATIKAPLKEQDTDLFMWQLRRSRILVLGNQAEAGAQSLIELLKQNSNLAPEQLDRLMQVVFDLQTAGQHEYAYRLFQLVLVQVKDEKVQREIYYWMADSQKAMESYVEAARLYMKSALHPDPQNLDPWAQTAMYHAAESLTRAGLYQDAQTLFERLLKVTEDANRRAALKRELQKLWALQ